MGLLLLSASSYTWASNVITTFAGSRIPSGPAINFSSPKISAAAIDSSGDIYYTEPGFHQIRKLDHTTGIATIIAGTGIAGFSGDGGPATSAMLNNPLGIAFDNSGNLYIADSSNNRIRKIDTSGAITTIAGTDTAGFSGDDGPATSAQLSGPNGIFVDGEGDIYIADSSNNRIRKIHVNNGVITTVAGNGAFSSSTDDNVPATSTSLNLPIGVVVDGLGNIYIADSQNERIRKVDVNGTITTVAGDGTFGFGGDDGAATSAALERPGGVALDGSGSIYIADTRNNRIRKIDTSGTITTVAGGGTDGFLGDGGAATSATLNSPTGVLLDSSGNIYIADTGNHRLRKVDTSNNISTVAGNGFFSFSGDGGPAGDAQLNGPQGVAVDSLGNIYIADAGNNRVRKIDTSGTITTVTGDGVGAYSGDGGPATSAELNIPVAVALDSAGNLYIADRLDTHVRKVDRSGTITTYAGGGMFGFGLKDGGPATEAPMGPVGVAVSGNVLYIADFALERIRKVDAHGIITTFAGTGSTIFGGDGGSATSATISLPNDFAEAQLAVDGSGNLYIADIDNQRIRKVNTSGTITTVAGSGSAGRFSGGFSGDDGLATSAQLNRPKGVFVDGSGNLYIADTDNNRIRKVNTSGTITTLAGTGTAGFNGDRRSSNSAQLNGPSGVAVNSSGVVYIADTGNNRIRSIVNLPTYTVTYDGNGDTGGLAPTDSNGYLNGDTVTVMGNTGSLVRAGYNFTGWNTATDGTGTSYAAGDAFSMGSGNITLYAQWMLIPTYTVTYAGNSNTGGSVPVDNANYQSGSTVTVLGNTGNLVKTGYNFTGWNTAANGTGTSYAAGGTFSMGSVNVTLYAQWTLIPTYTVTYNGNGSTGGSVLTDSNSYASGAIVIVLEDAGSFVRTGYNLTAWNTAADGTGTSYAAGEMFTMGSGNVTLYAQWTKATWVFIDGNGATGINFDPSKSGANPRMAMYNGELYVAWSEIDGSALQLRVKKYDGTNWISVDGGGSDGLNYDSSKNASLPHLEVFKGELYVTWDEQTPSFISQVRVKKYDGTNWTWVDGGGVGGVNQSADSNAFGPQLQTFQDKLYLIWSEAPNFLTPSQIRVKEYDGTGWTSIDGGGTTGINRDTTKPAQSPAWVVYDSGLYACWREGTPAGQVRVRKYNGNSSWTTVDGDAANGLNFDSTKDALISRFAVYNNELYLAWNEETAFFVTSGVIGEPRAHVKKYDGSTGWDFIDGGTSSGLNQKKASDLFPAAYNGSLYVAWYESLFAGSSIRVKKYDGTAWTFADGGGSVGVVKSSRAFTTIAQSITPSLLADGNRHLYMAWPEISSLGMQIRVATLVSFGVDSINLQTPSGAVTDATTVTFRVVFSEAVTGVDKDDFTLTANGASGVIASISPVDAATYDVTVNSIGGDGTLRLDLKNSETGIENTATPPVAISDGFTGGQSYTIDNTVPTVTIGSPSASMTKAGPVTFTVTYADSNFNASSLANSDITLNTTGSATGTVSVDAGTGTSRIVTISSISGDGTLGITIGAGTATDLAGHSASASSASTTFTVDNTAPSVTISQPSISGTVSGPVTYTVTYADANFDSSTLTASDITLNKSGTADGTVSLSGSGTSYTVTISGITGNGELGISIASGTAKDTVLNTTSSNGPSQTFAVGALVSAIDRATATPSNASAVSWTVTFSTSVSGVSAAHFSLSPSLAGATITSVTGSGTTWTVTASTGSGDGNIQLNLADTTGISPTLASILLFNGQSYTIDKTAPNAPSAPDLAATSDSGTSSTDDITNDSTPTFNGTAEPNSVVELFQGGATSLGTTLANGSGVWTFTVSSALPDGVYSITAKATDASGNVSSASSALSITIDTVAPTVGDIVNQTIAEDGTTGDLVLTISDNLTAANALSVAASSSDTTLIPNANIVLGGLAGNRTIKASPGANLHGVAVITVGVTDLAGNSASDTFNVTVTAVNDVPVLTASSGSASYTENSSAMVIDSGITATDVDDTQMTSGTVSITSGFTTGDVLAGTTTGTSITATYDSAHGVLSLSGTDTLAHYQAVLQTVAYSSTSDDPTGISAVRTITFALTDANAEGTGAQTGSATRGISITPLNDPPVLANALSDQSGTYGGTFSYTIPSNTFSDVDSGDTLAYSASGLPPGLSLDATTRVISGTMTAVGTYTVTITGTDSGSAHADASFTFTVNKATLTITAENKTKVYGAALSALTATYTGLVNNDTSADLDIPVSLSTTATDSSGVGTYPITASGASDANYSISFVPGTLTVNPATLTVMAENKAMIYGDSVPELTATYTGFVNGDVIASIPEPVSISTTATSVSAAGTYPIFVSGGSIPNYTIQRVQGTLTINKVKLIIKADDKSRKYQSANPTFTSTVTGAKNGEVIQVTYSTSATINSPVGTYPIVVGVSSRQKGIGNYEVILINGTLTVQDQADLAGLVHDGYVAGGTVFFDANNNRVLDAGEPSATTDDNGQFNISVKVSDFDRNKDGQLDASEGVLVVVGGVDIATGLPLQTPLTAPYGSTVLNPLTTLVSAALDQNPALSVAEAESSVAAGLGLSGVSLTQYDAFGGAKNDDPGATAVLSAGAKVQDSLVQVTALLTAASGQDNGRVAQAVAQALSAAVSSGSLDLSQPTAVQQVIEASAVNTGVTLKGQVAAKAAEVIAQGNQLIDQASAMTGSGAEIALEISSKQGVSQGDVAAILQQAAVAEVGDVQKIVDEAKQQQSQPSSVVGVLDGEDNRLGVFNFSQSEYEIQDLSKESAPITIFRTDGSKGAGMVVLALSLATGQDALTIPLNFANREIRKTVDVLELVRTNQMLLGAEEVAMHLLQSQSGSTNQAGLGETNRATLVLRSTPAWTAQPVDTDSFAGGRVEMHAIASGSPKPVYQWYKNGMLLPGQTGYQLVIEAVGLNDAGQYYAVASNVVGVITSQSAVLNVLAAPIVSLSETNQTVMLGAQVGITAQAQGTAPLSYQWKKNGVALAGQNSATLTLTHAQESDSGDYTVTVSNAYGSVTTTAAAHLEVQKPNLAILTMSRPVNGRMIVPLQGPVGQRARLEASADLVNWVTVTDVTFNENRVDYVETEFNKQRFYRLIAEAP